jgi:hypothetical protein
MIEMRRAQRSFGDGLIAEEVSDLREDWMRHADQVLADEQMWRPNTDAWALRGHLDSVAATIIDGETASRLRQEWLAGSRSREERSQRPVAGPRSSGR